MKILSLRLSNLASIAGEHCIDFEQAPLKNAGLIAITGITGAGKTTLLDAICLALFDQIPRLQHAEISKKITDASGEDIQINSTLNILRRGCVQGFAEVEFIAQDYKHYSARWEVKRARLKASGRLQPVQRSLRCITDDQLITERSKECNERMVKLLGLDFNQFTRAVLLAQSEVTAFLKAKDNERADLLEYLTNSDIYSRIGMASFAATKQAREKVEAIEKKIGDQLPLSNEERDSLLQQLKTSQQEMTRLQQAQQQHHNQIDWYTQQQQFVQNLAQQQTLLDTAQQQLNLFAPQQVLLKQLEQFEPIRACFLQQQQLTQQHGELLNQQQQSKQQAQLLEQTLKEQQQHYQRQLTASSTMQQQQQQLKPQLHLASQLEHRLASLSEQIQQQHGKLGQLNQQIQPKLAQQQQLQQRQDGLKTDLNQQQQVLQRTEKFALFDAEPQAAIQSLQKAATLRTTLQQQQADIFATSMADQQQQLQGFNQQLNELVQQHGSLDQIEQQAVQTQQQLESQQRHLSSCERIGDQLKQWLKVEQAITKLQQEHAALQQQYEPLQQRVHQATQHTQHAETQLKTTQQLVQEQRLFTAKSAQELRQQLKPEQPCMVCGSTEHPFYNPQNLLDALNEQLDDQAQQAEHALQQAREQELQQRNQFTRLQHSLEQLGNRQQQLQQDTQHILNEINHISPKFYQRLAGKLELGFAQQSLQEIQDKLGQTKASLEQQCKQQQSQLKVWQQLEKQQQQCQQLLEKRQELASLEQQTLSLLSEQHQQQWQHDCHTAQHELVQHIEQRQQAHVLVRQLNEQMVQMQQAFISLTASITHEQAQLNDLQEQIQQQQDQQQQTQQQLNELFKQHAPALNTYSSKDWQQQLEQQAQQQQQALEQASQQVQDTEKGHIKQQQQLDYLQQDLVKNQLGLQQAAQQIEQWQQAQPTVWQQDDIEKLLQYNYAHRQQLHQQLQDLQQNLQQAKNTLEVYSKQQHQHLASQPKLSQSELQHSLQELQHTAQQLDEQCTALKVRKMQDEQQQLQATQYMAQLEQAKAEYHRWDKISSLIGDAKGATFKKLAQQFHLQMLVELANQQLAALTPRYQLRCIEDSLGLTIVDHYMNDEVRPVLSLSGGESFLVSLALALGIANMASGTTKLESLFIDEGFGTLDQSSLHIVMDALDRLQSQGRKVVLISHIADMHERIPVKIQVIPQGSGASRIEVVG